MGTNRPWNWRLTIPKTIKMTLVRPLQDQFQDDSQDGNFPAVHWLGLCTLTAKGQGSIPGSGTRIPQATQRSQKKKKDRKKKDCQSWLCCFSMYPPPFTYKSSCLLIGAGWGVGLWTGVRPSPPVAGIWNKANFPFHQPCLFIGFWVASSWTPTFGNTAWQLMGLLNLRTHVFLIVLRNFLYYCFVSSPSYLLFANIFWDFPGGPVVKTSPSNAGDVGSISDWGAKIPHASQPKKQNIKKKKPKKQTETIL